MRRRHLREERPDPADRFDRSQLMHSQTNFCYRTKDIEAGREYNSFPGEAQPQSATRFDIISLVFYLLYLIGYLLSLLFVQERDRPPGPAIRLAISDAIRMNYPGIFSRRIPAPFEELRVRTPGDDPEPGVMPSTSLGFFANAHSTTVFGGTFSLAHQTIDKSSKYMLYLLLSIQTVLLF